MLNIKGQSIEKRNTPVIGELWNDKKVIAIVSKSEVLFHFIKVKGELVSVDVVEGAFGERGGKKRVALQEASKGFILHGSRKQKTEVQGFDVYSRDYTLYSYDKEGELVPIQEFPQIQKGIIAKVKAMI